MVRRDVRTTGKSLVQALGNTVDAELAALRKQVMEIVQAEKLKESQRKMGLEAVDDAEERLAKAVRRAGSAIRDQAQAVRTWRESYEAELHNSVTQAAEAHFKMLESIRDLALQKIGMKWAWMDGVTYKDWAKFHLLKERFEEWQGDFEKLIVTHPGLQAAQEEGADVEDEAMTRAAAAAQELARLKQVALWKLIARDDTDDFDGNVMAQKAAAAEKAAAEAHVAKLEAHRAFAAEYDSKAADAATESSESSESSESNAEPEPDLAQTMVLEETPVVADKASDVDDDVPGPAVLPEGEAAEQGETVQPPFLGAAAQWVPSRHPILDEEPALDKVQTAIGSLTLAAQAAFSGAVCRADQQYSQALSALSVQMSGARQPAHEKMLASATQAYSNVMAAASSRYSDAVSPAQQQQQQQHDATPTTPGLMDKLLPSAVPMPTISSIDWAAIEAMAAQKLNEGRAWAEEQYTSAQVAIGLATPAPSTPAEHAGRLLDTARHNYYAGLGLAHARYADFMAAASAAALSLTASPTPTDFVGSAMSAASAAGDTWDAVLSRVSAGVYGAPTPAPAPRCEQGLSRGLSEAAAAVAAKERYEAVSNLVAELLVGREPTFRESVFARLEQAYTTGAQGVGVVVDAAKETATALADGAAEAAGQATHVVKEAAAAVAGAEVQTMVRDEL